MRALIQRVSRGSVTIDGQIVGQIQRGLVIFLGVHAKDSEEDARYLAEKCVNLRIFSGPDGKFNLSCHDVEGELLVVSQFTLYGDTRRGRRPSFTDAAPPEESKPLYESFNRQLRSMGFKVEEGVFGAMMEVEIHNDGPVTLLVESRGTRNHAPA